MIEHKLKQRGIGRKPRTPQARTTKQVNPNSRHIPNEVKRQVLERDGEQCSYVSPDGRRCQQREWLEFHHKHPFACGGPATVDNVAVACRAHNWMFAVDDYGSSVMRECVDRSRRERRTAPLVPEPARQMASRVFRTPGQ